MILSKFTLQVYISGGGRPRLPGALHAPCHCLEAKIRFFLNINATCCLFFDTGHKKRPFSAPRLPAWLDCPLKCSLGGDAARQNKKMKIFLKKNGNSVGNSKKSRTFAIAIRK
jgi:hypothetical protein